MTIAQADVADAAQLARVLAEIEPPLRGVLHAAGVVDDALLTRLSVDRFAPVMAPKVRGAWNLHVQTANSPLDFFVMFSSGAALLGSPGQANYAAANAFMDALAARRCSEGLPAVSIAWGAWSEVGAAADRQVDHPVDPAVRRVTDEARAGEMRVPEEAVGIDTRAVGPRRGAGLGEHAPVRDAPLGKVEVEAPDRVGAGVGEIERAIVGAERDRVRDLDLVEHGMERTIEQKKVTYDFERLMTGATKVKTSEFAGYMIENMGAGVLV